MSEFYTILRQLRQARGLMQKDVADALGISKSSYSLYESGNREPNLDMLMKIAAFFDVSVDYLMTGEENEEQHYYLNDETAKVAQDIFENKELRILFDAARDADPEDLEAVHNMLLALKRKERKED